jgi:hypothetical protein
MLQGIDGVEEVVELESLLPPEVRLAVIRRRLGVLAVEIRDIGGLEIGHRGTSGLP